MGATTRISLQEYLETSYRPDCDYIDGEVLERNLGDFDHSDIQGALTAWFRVLSKTLGLWAGPELRVIVSPSRVRIPDVTVLLSRPAGRFVTEPPFLVIEVLSERDSLRSIQDRIDDYFAMGIHHIWVIDPETLRGWDASTGVPAEAKDGILRSREPEIVLPLADLR